jgi:hypothetical protein
MIGDTSRITPKNFWILPEPFPVPSSLFSNVSDESSTILSFGEPWSEFPYGWRITIHDQDIFLRSKIAKVFWRIIATPMCSTKMWSSFEPLHRISLPLLLRYRHSSDTWSMVSWYLVRPYYWQGFSTRSVWFFPRDLVMCCNLEIISPSGPRVSSLTRMNKSRSWLIRLNPSHCNT